MINLKLSNLITTVDAHTAGEPVRVVIGGIPRVIGNNILEKKEYFAKNYDHIRRLLMFEPRGHKDMYGAILTEPTREDCDFGVIFLDSGGYLDMCIHGCIGIVKVLLEIGMIQKKEPVTEVNLDTSAGKVKALAKIKGENIEEITIRNVPSFLAVPDLEIKVPNIGLVKVDIAFGGNFYAIVNSSDLQTSVETGNAHKLVELGLTIRNIVNREVKVQHPLNKSINRVNLVEICDEPKNPEATYRNAVIFGAGQVDRSPCGTGTCAKMATLYGKGQLSVGEEILSESIIGTLFKGKVVSETKVGNFKAIVPEITGKAYITGFHQFVVENGDSLKYGFIL